MINYEDGKAQAKYDMEDEEVEERSDALGKK